MRGILFSSFWRFLQYGVISGLVFFLVLTAGASRVLAETAGIEPDRDATLIEDPNGAFANGSGPNFFVGRTNQEQNGIRRALVRFPVAESLPPKPCDDPLFLLCSCCLPHPTIPRTCEEIVRALSDSGGTQRTQRSHRGHREMANQGMVEWHSAALCFSLLVLCDFSVSSVSPLCSLCSLRERPHEFLTTGGYSGM